MPRRQDWIIGGIICASVLLVLLLFLGAFSVLLKGKGPAIPKGKKVALVEVKGTILNSKSVVRKLRKHSRDGSILALVLRVESPGGSVAACQEIYEEVRRLRRSGMKIVASMGNIATSGGYYVAVAADTIVANPGTVTGSIGVIAQLANTEGLLRKLGIRFETVKSGRYKDIGSPFKKMTTEERQLLQGVIDDAYDQFVDAVVSERGLSREDVLKVADGRIFTGRQALTYGLVDLLGGYQDAIDLAGEMAGIGKDPPVIKEKERPNLFELLFGSITALPMLYYLLQGF
ncbi:MAG TPA: signal peptide peptidase SppA [Candidatus Latescibacteria bacterium]|nr:signal peptide peptidase SppA [Candidatus Latescibacterota bacterium]